ncbi:cytochrome P450 [Streptomyces sp. NBC_00083]|uniref:cytochrome P450 family protein n=1 Tax=Streptomyces sp. NBC_00083 TaxID=2975647 RepID=UPI002256D1FB|nr:cytochrome P450 [Streptomyces sp. NBC_00083]MCX5387354.1 cytochrome P450 [Streptomyces sp. NBC_00083]
MSEIATPADPATQIVDPEFFDHPHATYRAWREAGGARRARYPGPIPVEGWVVTSYADAKELLADPRLSKDGAVERFGRHVGLTQGPGSALFSHMLNTDPPHHTRLRKLVQKAFTQRRTAALRPAVEAHVSGLLDAWEGRDEVELISEFALPLPLAVVFDLFGASDADHETLQVRGNTLDGGQGDGEVSVFTADSMLTYLRALLALKRENPDDGLLSALVEARAEGEEALSEDEITSMAFLLVIAGHQTTVNLIANGIHTLLTHPEQLAALRADMTLMPGAVEEILRYESPSALASLRYAAEPVEVGEVTLDEGEFVQISLLGANRDPQVFPDPDRFDFRREDAAKHLAFGHGIHHCLGAPLARLQAEIAFTQLLNRYPGLRLSDDHEPRWQVNPRHRGLLSLPLRLTKS